MKERHLIGLFLDASLRATGGKATPLHCTLIIGYCIIAFAARLGEQNGGGLTWIRDRLRGVASSRGGGRRKKTTKRKRKKNQFFINQRTPMSFLDFLRSYNFYTGLTDVYIS